MIWITTTCIVIAASTFIGVLINTWLIHLNSNQELH